MRLNTLLLTLLAPLALNGCAPKEEPGPAEQIGRGVDQIFKGAREYSKEDQEREAERRRNARDSYQPPRDEFSYERKAPDEHEASGDPSDYWRK